MKKNQIKKIIDFITYLKNQPKGFVYSDKLDKKQALEALNKKYIGCMKCPLSTQGRTQVVFGNGNPHSQIIFVGEGPGKDEDLQGLPFVGRAGKLLTQIIESMKMKREDVYITNVVKCRPPNNRLPLPIESSTCTNLLLFNEIEIINPKVICTLGSTAAKALLGEYTQLSHVRGRFQQAENRVILPTYHPAYLLRNPAEKKTVWHDMQQIIRYLENN